MRLTECNSKLKEKEKNCSEITRIALTKREDVEADSAVCPHTMVPEYACFSTMLLHCKLWFYILYILIWCINLMLLVDKDAFGPFSLHIFQIWSLVLEFFSLTKRYMVLSFCIFQIWSLVLKLSSLTKRCLYPLVQSPFLIVADCIPDEFCLL